MSTLYCCLVSQLSHIVDRCVPAIRRGLFLLSFIVSVGGVQPSFAADTSTAELVLTTGAVVSDALVPDRAKPATAFPIVVNEIKLQDETFVVDVGSRRFTLAGRPSSISVQDAMSWTGRLAGDATSSSAVFTWRHERFAGQLTVGQQRFEFTTDSSGRALVFEINPEKVRLYPDGGTDVELLQWTPDVDDDVTDVTDSGRRDGTVSEVDLMVVYTGAACNERGRDSDGGCSAIEASVVSAIELGNVAFANSGVAARLRIVHMSEVNYFESGDMTRSLSDLRAGQSTASAAIHDLRNVHRADLVSLVTIDNNLCGYAIRPVRFGPGSDLFGFSVVAQECILEALVHELGHNFGAAHDRTNTSSAALAGNLVTPNAFGYRNCGQNSYVTIMSYGNNCGQPTRLSHFSSPTARTSDGRITGTGGENNVQALNFTAPLIAAYRSGATVNTAPVANPDTVFSTGDGVISVDVLGNDFDAQGPVTLDSITLPGGWTWRSVGTRVLITPPQGFVGERVVSYRISDSGGLTDSSSIRIVVTSPEPVNRAPVAVADYFQVSAGVGASLNVLANDSDPDGDRLLLDSVTVANGWVARVSGAQLVVTAPASYRGTYQFRYTLKDEGGASGSALVTLTVVAPSVTPPPTPAVPKAARATGLSYHFNSARTVVLRWTDVANNELRYQIIRDREVIDEIGANSRRYVDRLRPIGASHEYRVRAMSAGGGQSSAPVRVVIGEPTLTARVIPRNAAQSLVVLQWTGASGAAVAIKRGGGVAARVANDGNHAIVFTKGRRVAYRVCNAAQTLCSRPVVVTH